MLNQDEVTEKANEIVESIKEILIKSGQHHKNFDYYKHSTKIAILHVEKIVKDLNWFVKIGYSGTGYGYVDYKLKEQNQILSNLKKRIK